MTSLIFFFFGWRFVRDIGQVCQRHDEIVRFPTLLYVILAVLTSLEQNINIDKALLLFLTQALMQDLHTSLCATENKSSQWILILLFGPHESRFIIKCYVFPMARFWRRRAVAALLLYRLTWMYFKAKVLPFRLLSSTFRECVSLLPHLHLNSLPRIRYLLGYLHPQFSVLYVQRPLMLLLPYDINHWGLRWGIY